MLVSQNLYHPKSLSIDQINWKLYFINFFESTTTIERISLDGSNREILVN